MINTKLLLENFEGIQFLLSNRAFLGNEFLTWLLFSIGNRDGSFAFMHKDNKFNICLDGKIGLIDSKGEINVKGGDYAVSQEIKESLRKGMKVNTLRVNVMHGEACWVFALNGKDLFPRQIKVPSVDAPDAAQHICKRIELVEVVLGMIETLFKRYMEMRLSPAFEADVLIPFRAWLDADLG
jgi:hypothetical protein